MAKVKDKKTNRLLFLGIVIAIMGTLIFFKYSLLPSQSSSTAYQTYQNPAHGFQIEYPKAWKIRKDTQLFENGDAVAFGIQGPTQKKQTELTDGAQVAVSKPFSITTNLALWVKEYHGKQAEFSQNTINGALFEKVYKCSNLGCLTYYYTLNNGQVYGLAVFAQGPDKDKMVYENSIVYMLKSLKFTNVKGGSLSKEEAIAKVKALSEVTDYLKKVPNGLVLISGEENDQYLVQVYEIKNEHTATFNWYNVDKTTGEVKKEF